MWCRKLIFIELLLLVTGIQSQKGVPFAPIINFQVGSLTSPVTVVSSHYDIKLSKRNANHYRLWWPQTLTLNCTYIIYTDDEAVGLAMLNVRKELPTVISYRNLNDSFSVPILLPNMTIRQHVPSIELGIIWAEKTELINLAHKSNYFQSDWYAWVDSGNALYRKIKMPVDAWPNPRALEMLPHNRLLHTASWFPWHVVEVAGTAYMYHKNMISVIRNEMEAGYLWCRTNHRAERYYDCASDQYVLTRIKHWRPDLFYQIGYGYGDLVRKLFKDSVPETNYSSYWDVCDEGVQVSERGCDRWLVELPV